MSAIPVSAAMRRLSKLVFGQELRIAAMLYVGRHPDGLFCLSDLADGIDVRSASSVQDPLRALVESGLIAHQVGLPGDRHRWYRRLDSSAWSFAEELASQVNQSADNDATRGP